MLFQKMANYASLETLLKPLLIGYWPKKKLQQNSFKKCCSNFSMHNFRYILGLLKKTLSRVKIKDLTLTFLITSSKSVSQGTAVI